VIAGFHNGVTTGLPAGVTASEWEERQPGALGGRISCATLQGDTTGQACIAVETSTMLVVIDVVAANSPIDPDFPRRIREAVIHRTAQR
jgi:hypothetical protein